jgi:large subunit ribosomal protein L1
MPAAKKRKNKNSVRYVALTGKVEAEKLYDVDEAIEAVKATASAKFVETVDVSIRLGIDPKKGDQNVRGITQLPHGTGKVRKVAVLAKGEQARAAEEAGADVVGEEDLIRRIQEGWKDFDVMLATSDMAPQIGKIARILGPRTPNKRNGTVTDDIVASITQIKKATRVEYRAEKAGIVHLPLGKVNFTNEQIRENFLTAVDALIKAKPSSSKGKYLRSITLSCTMGPGVSVDTGLATKASGH